MSAHVRTNSLSRTEYTRVDARKGTRNCQRGRLERKSSDSFFRDEESKYLRTENVTVVPTLAKAGIQVAACPFGAMNNVLLPFEVGEVDAVPERGLPFLEVRHHSVLHPLVELDPVVISRGHIRQRVDEVSATGKRNPAGTVW